MDVKRYHVSTSPDEFNRDLYDTCPERYVDLDRELCADAVCTREHVHVLTVDEYRAVNEYVRQLDVDHIGTPTDDDDYIADALDDFHAASMQRAR